MKPSYHKYMQVEEAELVCRMVEAFEPTQRPAGMSADQALENMPPDIRVRWLRVSQAVSEYWNECLDGAATIQ